MHHSFLEHLDWRRAEKHFDPNYQIPQESLTKILEAAHLAPSSFGLQPYHIYVVKNPEIRAQLQEKGFHQAQFTEASVLLVFATVDDLDSRISGYMKLIGGNEQLEQMMKGFVAHLPNEHAQRAWSARQAYIALGFALAAAAELEIDSCPMEGFDKEGFDQILGLPEGHKSVVVLSLGKRQKEEPDHPKVRFPNEDIFTEI